VLKTLALIPPRKSFAIAEQAKITPGPVLMIVNDPIQKQALLHELPFFYPHDIYDFPDWETLPYDPFSPHVDIISERLRLLITLPRLNQGIILISAQTLLAPLPPPTFIRHHAFSIQKGDELDLNKERLTLIAASYHQVDQVFERGEYSVRGSILDIFPMGAKTPYRIDLFDKNVDSIADFDPETQRRLNTFEAIELLPTHEFPLDQASLQKFIARYEASLGPLPTAFAPLKKGLPIQGLEYYLPLFFENNTSFFDYLPPNTEIIFEDALEATWDTLYQDIETRYQEKYYDTDRPPLPPKLLFQRKEQLFSQLKEFSRLLFTRELAKSGPLRTRDSGIALPAFNLTAPTGLAMLNAFLEKYHDYQIVFTAETEGRLQLLSEYFTRQGIQGMQSIAPLQQGWIDPALKQAYIPEPCLFPDKYFPPLSRKKASAPQANTVDPFNDFAELNPGDIVVHLHHGIGRYVGLTSLTLQEQAQEFLTLEYQNNDKLYVPIQDLGLLSRYSMGHLEHVQLNQLGSDKWQKTREKAAKRITDIAAELLELYAARKAKSGFAFHFNPSDYADFVAGFPYDETEDQQQAINAVLADMQAPTPMDRLLCGDVGFGKTEVAMRAAFLAVQNAKQVVILVPTTLLAEQHYENFVNRFAAFPIKVAHFSRFTSKKQELETLNGIASGQVDIIIGTHKIIRSSMPFKDLGLIIIDEEHRFGVKDKERLKSLKSNVDVLTMTATPIPRTLNFSLATLRDLSIIATPPKKRLSVNTFVREWNRGLIKEAILREVLRGGQVYYLHNDVASIEECALKLREWLPQLTFSIAHGQMPQRSLEHVMADFYHNRSQVLICSTLIETGIDIPNANTMIIEQADRFGLAQLHQLRGRVGRSHHQAYAYLLTPPKDALTRDAQKRLEVLEKSTALGSGFTLASHDLEIRGAGEILGEGQSGHMEDIGFSLYQELLDRALSHLKKGIALQPQDLLIQDQSEVELNIPRLLPDDYVADVHTRLKLYQRLPKIQQEQALLDFKIELIDRFGPLPPPALFLLEAHRLKLKAKALGITRIEAHATQAKFTLSASPHFDVLRLIRLVQTHSGSLQLRGEHLLLLKKELPQAEDRIKAVDWILNELGGSHGFT
jgi:transcription-repair coupling factor (superfamily II helicase)